MIQATSRPTIKGHWSMRCRTSEYLRALDDSSTGMQVESEQLPYPIGALPVEVEGRQGRGIKQLIDLSRSGVLDRLERGPIESPRPHRGGWPAASVERSFLRP